MYLSFLLYVPHALPITFLTIFLGIWLKRQLWKCLCYENLKCCLLYISLDLRVKITINVSILFITKLTNDYNYSRDTWYRWGYERAYMVFNTFTAKVDHSRFNNSCLGLPASTLVNLIFQSCSFSLGGKLVQQLQYIYLMLSLSLL
jgi:hypothetical protein